MNHGGAENMIMNYYRHVDRTKIQFDFLLHRKEKGTFDDEIKSLGGKIYYMENLSIKKISAYIKSLDTFFKKHHEFKIVHSHLNAYSVFVLRAAKKNRVPIRIAHSHTSLYNINLNPFSKERNSLNFIVKFLSQNILKHKITTYSNCYFSCGEKAGNWLFGKKNASKVKIINNAINSDAFIYDKDKSLEIKKQLQVEGTLVIGHIGNFVPEKNHLFLLKVYQELKKMDANTSLVLVGDLRINELEKLIDKKNISDDIKVLGTRNDIPEILQSIDIFLFPSINEGLPVTLIEAQAAGIKTIASEEITKEVKITHLIDYISLHQPPKFWAEQILNSYPYERVNTKDQIISGGYDIKNNAILLQDYYIDQCS
tara:strand:+ start:11853 stop:12959 length:1107 start_codon:yes stop_codon:yes gene_type:complete